MVKSKDRLKREESKEKETMKLLRSELRKIQKELKKYKEDMDFLKIFKRVTRLEEENLVLKKRIKNMGKVLGKKGKDPKKVEDASGDCECGGFFEVRVFGKVSIKICQKCKERERVYDS